ncbi:MAG: hypothetical protein ACE5NA_00140 [Nitrospiraceae bacterium]
MLDRLTDSERVGLVGLLIGRSIKSAHGEFYRLYEGAHEYEQCSFRKYRSSGQFLCDLEDWRTAHGLSEIPYARRIDRVSALSDLIEESIQRLREIPYDETLSFTRMTKSITSTLSDLREETQHLESDGQSSGRSRIEEFMDAMRSMQHERDLRTFEELPAPKVS